MPVMFGKKLGLHCLTMHAYTYFDKVNRHTVVCIVIKPSLMFSKLYYYGFGTFPDNLQIGTRRWTDNSIHYSCTL